MDLKLHELLLSGLTYRSKSDGCFDYLTMVYTKSNMAIGI